MISLNIFLPQTIDEFWLRMGERMGLAWPTFGQQGAPKELSIHSFERGAVVRFVAADGMTFHPDAVMRQGAVWLWSRKRSNRYVYSSPDQLRDFMIANELNWVEIK